MNNDRSVINEEPGEDEESSATQESVVSPSCEAALRHRRVFVELNTEEFSPTRQEVIQEEELEEDDGLHEHLEHEASAEEEEWNNCQEVTVTNTSVID